METVPAPIDPERKARFYCRLGMAACALMAGVALYFLVIIDTETVTVRRVYESKHNSTGHYVAVARENGKVETLSNEDDWRFLKFNSTSLQDSLQVGHRYRMMVCGVRFPILSWFRNLVSAREIVDDENQEF